MLQMTKLLTFEAVVCLIRSFISNIRVYFFMSFLIFCAHTHKKKNDKRKNDEIMH